MSEEEISKIDYYIKFGEPKKALDYIETIDRNQLSNLECDVLDTYLGEALERYGHTEEAFQLYEKLIPKFEEHKIPKYNLLMLIFQANMLNFKNQSKEALILLKQKKKILNRLSIEELDQLYEERIGLLVAEGTANFHLRDYKRFVKTAKKSLEIAERSNDKYYIGVALNNLADSYRRLGEGEKSWDFREEALRVFKEIKNDYRIAHVLHSYGHYYSELGEYEKAIDHYLKILPFVERTENDYQKFTILLHLAWTYFANLQDDIAYDYNLQAYQLFDKINHPEIKEIILGRLIDKSVEIGDFEKADEYLEELKPILQQTKSSYYDLELKHYEIKKKTKIFIDTKNNLIRDELENNLREIIDDDNLDESHKWDAKFALCRLLLVEFIETRNNEIIEEIDTKTSNLLQYLSKYDKRIIPRIAVLFLRLLVLWIQAKIDGDMEKLEETQKLMLKTEEFAGVKGNKLLLRYLKDNRMYYTTFTDELIAFVEKYIRVE